MFALFLLFGSPMRRRRANLVPSDGPLLIFANHISNCDPVLLQWSCPRLVNFMARREIFSMGLLGKFVSWWRAFPVTQSSADKEAIRTALKLIGAGHAVVVFPEGQLSPTGELIELLPGASLLARKTGVRCICVGLTGTNVIVPYPETRPRWAGVPLVATWGEPRTFEPKADPETVMGWIREELLRLTGQSGRSDAVGS